VRVGNILDIGPVKETRVVTDLEDVLALLEHIHESGCALGITGTKDATGTQGAGQETVAVGLEDHVLRNGLGLGVGFDEGLWDGCGLVRIDEGRAVREDTGGGGVDKTTDVLGQTGVNDVLGAVNVDPLELFSREVVRGGSDVHADVVALERGPDGGSVRDVSGEVGDAVGVDGVGGDEDVEDGDGIVCALDQFLDDPSAEESVSSGDQALCL